MEDEVLKKRMAVLFCSLVLTAVGVFPAAAGEWELSEDGKYVWVPFEKVDSTNVGKYQ